MADSIDKPKPDIATAMAAERTFLAWIRTGLAMMGFGFVVARFGIFMREMEQARHAAYSGTGKSALIGTALVLLGMLLCLACSVVHVRNMRAIMENRPVSMSFAIWGAVVVAILLAMVGLLMSIYLINLQ